MKAITQSIETKENIGERVKKNHLSWPINEVTPVKRKPP